MEEKKANKMLGDIDKLAREAYKLWEAERDSPDRDEDIFKKISEMRDALLEANRLLGWIVTPKSQW